MVGDWAIKIGRALFREKLLVAAVVAGVASFVMTYHAAVPDNLQEGGLQALSAVYEVGQIRQGVVAAKFDLVNHSLLPVRIAHVVKSCRCGKIDAPSREIAPSESVTIDCEWDTSGMRGKEESTFVLMYSEGGNAGLRSLPLVMRGEVIPEFDYSPARLTFREGKAATQSVKFVPKTPATDIVVEAASCSHEAFSVTLRNQREVDVSFLPDLWPNGGQLTARLKIVTNCRTDRNLWMPIYVLPNANGR